MRVRPPNIPTSSRPASSGCRKAPLFRAVRTCSKIGAQTVPATITGIKHRINVNTLEHTAATKLELNEVGTVTIATDADRLRRLQHQRPDRRLHSDRPPVQRYARCRRDRFRPAPRQNLSYQSFDVTRDVRAAKHQTPQIVWFTGLSGSGKSTVANLVEKRLTWTWPSRLHPRWR
jgi:bifunctional enzyme CysN/CysC